MGVSHGVYMHVINVYRNYSTHIDIHTGTLGSLKVPRTTTSHGINRVQCTPCDVRMCNVESAAVLSCSFGPVRSCVVRLRSTVNAEADMCWHTYTVHTEVQ